jgi:hypothetical protein
MYIFSNAAEQMMRAVAVGLLRDTAPFKIQCLCTVMSSLVMSNYSCDTVSYDEQSVTILFHDN